MSVLAIFSLSAFVVFTSFLSGVFGMAGGMVLMGGLVFLLPVGHAMILHGFIQAFANGGRAVMWRKHVQWGIVLRFVLGLVAVTAVMSWVSFSPAMSVVLIALGIVPFLALSIPKKWVPQATSRGGAELCGALCTFFQLLSGVSGPTLDVFFVRETYNRHQVIATKAACQLFGHLGKLIYFGLLVVAVPDEFPVAYWTLCLFALLAIWGTSLSKVVLERLTDQSFRKYTQWIVAAIGAVYLVRGLSAYLGA